MTKGQGLIGLLYAAKDLFEAGVLTLITGVAILAFFGIIIKYIGDKYDLWGIISGSGGLSERKKTSGRTIVYALFLLFVIVSLYSLIDLLAQIFGLNSAPAGGIILR